jgi:hypothetical protein
MSRNYLASNNAQQIAKVLDLLIFKPAVRLRERR